MLVCPMLSSAIGAAAGYGRRGMRGRVCVGGKGRRMRLEMREGLRRSLCNVLSAHTHARARVWKMRDGGGSGGGGGDNYRDASRG